MKPGQKLEKKSDMIDGVRIKYHANGSTVWSQGKEVDGKSDGYWEWYRIDGTLKRSGHFDLGIQDGEWITYDKDGEVYKRTHMKTAK